MAPKKENFLFISLLRQKGKFLIYFFITSKVIDGMSWKIYEFVGVMQAVSVENCPKRVR